MAGCDVHDPQRSAHQHGHAVRGRLRDGAMSSPTQRTLAELRKRGYPLVQVVERWNPHAKVRQDMFGIIDVFAVGDDIVAVQATSGSNVSARVAKITESDALAHLRRANIRVLVHGWTKRANGRYELREVDLS